MKSELKELLSNIMEVSKYIHQRSYHKTNDKHLYPGQPKLLSLIKANEGITQKDLSKLSFVTPATITGMLNKLEANHYLYRVPDEVDKRIMRVYLTQEGKDLATHAEMHVSAMIEQLFSDFSDEELKTLITLSQKMKNNMHNHEKS